MDNIFDRPSNIDTALLQYTLYPPQSSKAEVTALATCIHALVDSLLPDFLWHADPFEVGVVPDPQHKDAWLLQGRMRVGDCVDDEWCVVWLLKEISVRWDVVIRYTSDHSCTSQHDELIQFRCSVTDSDGEFLLIEAAEALPSWLTPSNAQNRVRCTHILKERTFIVEYL